MKILLRLLPILSLIACSIAHAQVNLYVSIDGDTGTFGGSIVEYTPTASPSTFASGLAHPRGMAFDSGGNFFAAVTFATRIPGDNPHGQILEYPPLGHQSVLGNTALSTFESVVTDSAGNVFAVALGGFGQPCTVYKFAPDGTRNIFGSTPPPTQTFGLAFDSAGNLFAADGVAQTIYEFSPTGARTVFAAPSAFSLHEKPTGLAFDNVGNLFVSTEGNLGNDRVLEFTPSGMESSFATGLNNPRGLTFDADGDLFVAESLPSGDILEFTTGGEQIVFAFGIAYPEFLSFGPAR